MSPRGNGIPSPAHYGANLPGSTNRAGLHFLSLFYNVFSPAPVPRGLHVSHVLCMPLAWTLLEVRLGGMGKEAYPGHQGAAPPVHPEDGGS